MESLDSQLQELLGKYKNHFSMQENGKIKCEINGHTLPPRFDVVSTFIQGPKFQNLLKRHQAEDVLKKYEPFIVQSKNFPLMLYCALTGQLMDKSVEAVKKHMQGKKFMRAKERFTNDKIDLKPEPSLESFGIRLPKGEADANDSDQQQQQQGKDKASKQQGKAANGAAAAAANGAAGNGAAGAEGDDQPAFWVPSDEGASSEGAGSDDEVESGSEQQDDEDAAAAGGSSGEGEDVDMDGAAEEQLEAGPSAAAAADPMEEDTPAQQHQQHKTGSKKSKAAAAAAAAGAGSSKGGKQRQKQGKPAKAAAAGTAGTAGAKTQQNVTRPNAAKKAKH